jgi:hypothetical protein
MGFYVPEDDILQSHKNVADGTVVLWRNLGHINMI